jgi:aminobenzoyl-glutamate transport protein
MDNKLDAKAGPLLRFLSVVEKIGNALPHPAFLFMGLFFVVLLLSWLATALSFSAVHPITKELITTVNLFSVPGLHLLIANMVSNFASFAPLASVLVAMLGFSLAEKSELLSTVLKLIVVKAPKPFIVPVIFAAGVMSHTAGDIGYVLLIPLAAMLFHSIGLHPLAGIAACFAAVSGGFAANFLLSTADPMLAGLSQEAARIIDPSYVVTPMANWYFMASSGILIVIAGTLVVHKITIPYLGEYQGAHAEVHTQTVTSAADKKGLWWAAAVALTLTSILAAGLIPEGGFLRDPATGSLLKSPVLKGVVAVIFFYGSLCGLAFGFASGRFRTQSDIIQAMQESMAKMAPYLVLVFFAAQFINFFNASNIGMILAVHGSGFLKELGLGAVPLMLGFILLTCFLDLVIGSASAKWTLMAPIFVPMFMLLGYAPELTQASYRIADSVVNIISPLMSYFPLILAFVNRYEPSAKVGTIVALMLPYSLTFLALWSLYLFVWIQLELPLGPGGSLFYQIGQ